MKILSTQYLSLGVILVGILLLIRIVYHAFTGTLSTTYFDPAVVNLNPLPYLFYAMALKLPVAFHVISIGLIFRRKLLSPLWQKIAWFSIVLSGCWLGVALAIRLIFF